MARNTTLKDRGVITVRSASAVIAADSATLTDANIVPSLALDCSGLDSIFVGSEITGGTNPAMTLELLFRDDGAADGSRWFRLATAAYQSAGPLVPNANFAELRVYGQKVFLRIASVLNATNTTAWKILAMPGAARPVGRFSRY